MCIRDRLYGAYVHFYRYCLLVPYSGSTAEEGRHLSRIVRFASTAASLSTEKPGGIPSIAEYETVVGRM